jgi:hypothetical protein
MAKKCTKQCIKGLKHAGTVRRSPAEEVNWCPVHNVFFLSTEPMRGTPSDLMKRLEVSGRTGDFTPEEFGRKVLKLKKIVVR